MDFDNLFRLGDYHIPQYKIKFLLFHNYAYEKRESLYYNLGPCKFHITV